MRNGLGIHDNFKSKFTMLWRNPDVCAAVFAIVLIFILLFSSCRMTVNFAVHSCSPQQDRAGVRPGQQLSGLHTFSLNGGQLAPHRAGRSTITGQVPAFDKTSLSSVAVGEAQPSTAF